jgi:hypothetical protein
MRSRVDPLVGICDRPRKLAGCWYEGAAKTCRFYRCEGYGGSVFEPDRNLNTETYALKSATLIPLCTNTQQAISTPFVLRIILTHVHEKHYGTLSSAISD